MRTSEIGILPTVVLLSCMTMVRAEQDPGAVPVPKATPVEDLLPKFEGDRAVTSRTQQFTVMGGDSATRGTAANLSEEVKSEILRLTEEKDEWKVPVKIELRGKPGDPVPLRPTAMRISFSENGYEVRIYVNLSRGLQREAFRRAVYSGLIYARGLKDRGLVESEVAMRVPPWFVEGLMEASAWRLKQTDRRLYDALFRHGGLFKLEDLFSLNEGEYESIDAASKAAFRVSSGALVMALLEQPEGSAGIRDFLAELSDFQGEMPALLRQHFPDLNFSETSLEKLWQLQLANKGTAPLTEAYDVPRTERLLIEALRLRYKDGEGVLREVAFAEWAQIPELEIPVRQEVVRQAQDDLIRLSYRCFPSYRVLLLEYQALLTDYATGKTDGLAESIRMLEETRQSMVAKADRARDFLDWFEITRARETSGAFDDYLNLKARLKTRPDRRTDSLSKYLDRLDPLFRVPEKTEDFGMTMELPPF